MDHTIRGILMMVDKFYSLGKPFKLGIFLKLIRTINTLSCNYFHGLFTAVKTSRVTAIFKKYTPY